MATKKTILIALITHYNKVIKGLPKVFNEDLINYLCSYDTDMGICACSLYQFGNDIYQSKWVKKHTRNGSDYWLKVPCDGDNRKEIKALLKGRVDIMKKILKTCK